jgi:hypothetical protein
MDQPKYLSSFAAHHVKCVIGEERDKFLSIASLENLRAFIPNIDPKNIDLLPISFDAFVANNGNKNGDILDTNLSLGIYKTFIWKFTDVEHSRAKPCGVIITASLSEYGTNKPLTEEDVKGKDTPFCITLGGVLWRAVSQDLCNLVESSNDPDSEHFMSIGASWELAFSSFHVVEMDQGEKNLSKGTIIKDPETIEKLKKYLKCFGGSGVKDGKSYYRMPNENVIAMGIGLTEKPAADVKGIATKIEETKASETIVLEAPVKKVEKIISQSQETNVKTRRETNMKITSITDITDENLKQCTASSVTEFIQSELKKASESYVAEKQQQATANTKLQETTENLNKSVKEMKASLDTLQKEKADRDKVDSFNAHMSEVCASYELPEDVTKIVVDDLKSLATEEAFAAWKTKASTLLKSYSKAEAKAKKDKEAADKALEDKADKDKADKDAVKASEDEMEAKKKTPKANIAIASAVEGALDNADKEKGGLPNTSTASAPGLKEKFAAAFAEDNFVITK